MFNLQTLFGQHEVYGWRDDYTLVAAATLNEVAARLGDAIDTAVGDASYQDVFLLPSRFLTTKIAPMVRAAAEPEIERIMAEANAALARIVAHQAVWHRAAANDATPGEAWEGLGDIARAAAPLAGGAALAAALPGMAITTTTAWFGLVTATAISWPVVLVGGAAAGTAVATGMFNTARLRDRFEARLRDKARALAATMLVRGTPKQPAVLEQLAAALARAADEARAM